MHEMCEEVPEAIHFPGLCEARPMRVFPPTKILLLFHIILPRLMTHRHPQNLGTRI